jgi:hypothetical protein
MATVELPRHAATSDRSRYGAGVAPTLPRGCAASHSATMFA